MDRRKIRDEREAVEALKAQRASGLTLAAWARHEGIDGRSLNMWRTNLARRGQRDDVVPPRLVELVTAGARAARYTVRCGRMAVEVGDDFDQDALFRLLQVVAAC